MMANSPVHSATDGGQTRLTCLPPVISRTTVLLVLGSFPGEASLAAQQYYGHPRNHFWQIIAKLWPALPDGEGEVGYAARKRFVLEKGLGLWDVYAACERVGSLDSSIRQAELNDLAGLAERCPRLQAIAHNGGESHRHAVKVATLVEPRFGRTLRFDRLPSTSPANASWSFERKLAAWRDVFAEHKLI